MNFCQNPGGTRDFENVEMGDAVRGQGRVRVPRRTIFFASGETMEEYSTDEEEEEEDPVKKDVITVDPVGFDLKKFYSHFTGLIRVLWTLKQPRTEGQSCGCCSHDSNPFLRTLWGNAT